MEKFQNRYEAGQVLAAALQSYANNPDVIVLALPRGGVPVGYEIAKALAAPLDVFIVRKLGVPGHEELALGAIASGNEIFFNEELLNDLNLSQDKIQAVINKEQHRLAEQEELYHQHAPLLDLKEKLIILVDDGVATGATVHTAINALRKLNPARLILAVPVAASSTYQEIKKLVDDIVCPLQPMQFYAVGLWFEDFGQTTDLEVANLLRASRKWRQQ